MILFELKQSHHEHPQKTGTFRLSLPLDGFNWRNESMEYIVKFGSNLGGSYGLRYPKNQYTLGEKEDGTPF